MTSGFETEKAPEMRIRTRYEAAERAPPQPWAATPRPPHTRTLAVSRAVKTVVLVTSVQGCKAHSKDGRETGAKPEVTGTREWNLGNVSLKCFLL